MSLIYEPAEDSFLFKEFLQEYFADIDNSKSKILEMGCGSCILSETLRDLGFTEILCADINKDAVNLAKKLGFNAIQTDLFENIKEKFDYIIFNPPYLPKDPLEDEESSLITTGGEKGDEIIVKFLKQTQNFLNDSGKIFVLISSLTPTKNLGKYKIVARKKIFYEELFILEFDN